MERGTEPGADEYVLTWRSMIAATTGGHMKKPIYPLDLTKSTEELKKLTEKEAQKAHHIELLRNRYKEEKRRSRTHRLIERGAILESILPDAESYSNEQIKHILRVAFSSLPVNLKGAFFHDDTDEEL